MKRQHYLLKDVAKILKRKPYQIAYCLSVGLVPEPETRIANKRIFTPEDIERLAAHFGVELAKDKGKHREVAADAVR